MSRGVKLVSLAVQDVGAITGRIELAPFSTGVSIVSGRNEAGKSTLVAALRAALFERHDAKNANVKALQTHGTSNPPEIWVELDIGGERLSVHKRFLVKPLVEVGLKGDGGAQQGSSAEELLLRKLEGRTPNQRGAKRSDMGLWGLLWVTQDEIAHQDPGEDLDEGMRGDLWDTVGRQVGQMTGGKRGERVRTAVLEQRSRYLTATTEKPTGVYRAAIERRDKAQARVREIQQAIDKVEDLARQRHAVGEQLREKDRQLPRLQQEHAAAVVAADKVTKLATSAREAKGQLEAAETALAAAEKGEHERVTLALDVANLASEIRKSDAVIAELEEMLAPRVAKAREARDGQEAAGREAAAAREALDAEARRLGRARRQAEAARIGEQLARAEEVAAGLHKAVQEHAAEALDEGTLEQLSRLASRVATLQARLDAEGTRIVCRATNGEPIVRSFGVRGTMEVPGLGVLEVEPARPGLARAAVDVEKLRAQLTEALLALGAAEVQVARDRAEARGVLEDELAVLTAKKLEIAPHGIEGLEQKVRAIEAERAQLDVALVHAASAEQVRDTAARALADNPFREDTLDGLRRKEKDVAIQRAECDAMGTQVEIVALSDLRVRGASPAGGRLAAGERLPFAVTQATTVVLEDVAEFRFEPRGRDLTKSRGKLAQAEEDLSASLVALGVATLAEAAEGARAWRDLETARTGAEQRVTELAPQGVAKLRAAAEKVRSSCGRAQESLVHAKTVFARHAQVEVALAHNPATRESLSRIEKLEQKLRERDAEVEHLSARVRAISGPIAEGPTRSWTVASPVKPPAVNGMVWEILPGEVGGELDVVGEEHRLREALHRAGVADVDVARSRMHAGLKLGAQIGELRKQLGSLAPEGIDALRARAGALLSGSDPPEPAAEAMEIGLLEASVHQLDERLRDAHKKADDAAQAAVRAEQARVDLDGSLCERRGARSEKAAHYEAMRAKLDGARAVEPDADLHERLTSAQAARNDAIVRAQGATAELDAATPELLQDEQSRADGAITSWKVSHGKLSDDALRLDTLLGVAAAEGCFDDLGEAKAEELEAAEALLRIEREAGAARLLSRVVEDAYNESQRIFLGPVLKEARPYLTKLRPGTEIRMTRDLKLDKVVRRGAEEDFGELSGGTREQLSVIVRLALARVLARDNRSLPLILDDTMGWTDDERFVSMVQILRDASRDLQIILLTCHPSRFERFQAERRFDLDQLREQPSPEARG